MPEQIKVKMNGLIPSVPITTLAGIASLTDLLPEMPLPTPLPQTLTNKSLLFHPRVAEEAQILLSVRDENLVPQLILSLSQTSSDHIELKDHYANTEQSPEAQQNTPELLKAILQINPHVFKGPQYNSPRNWSTQGQQQANYGRFSPSYSNSSGSRQTPQGSPAHPAAARTVLPPPVGMSHAQHPRMPQNHTDVSQTSPFAVPSPSPRATVITEQTRTSTTPQHMSEDSNCLNSLSNMTTQLNMHSPAHIGSPNTPMSALGNLTPQHHSMSSIMTPQHSMQLTPPTDSSLPSTPQHHPHHHQHHLHHHEQHQPLVQQHQHEQYAQHQQEQHLQHQHDQRLHEQHPQHQLEPHTQNQHKQHAQHMQSPHEQSQNQQQQQQQQHDQHHTLHAQQQQNYHHAQQQQQHQQQQQQQRQVQQPIDMPHQIFDSMVNEQLQQSMHSQPMEIASPVQTNQQFILDPVTGLPDIHLPIDTLQASHNAREAIPPSVGLSQSCAFPNVNTSASLDTAAILPEAISTPQQSMPLEPQQIMEPYQQLQLLHLEQQQLQLQQNQQYEQQMLQQQQQQQQQNKLLEKDAVIPALKEPIVMLNRLSLADQALMKKSLTAFAEKSPTRAAKMGLTNCESKSDSDSEEEVGKNNKYFKSRAKERQVQKEKEKAEMKKEDRTRRRKRILEEDEESEDKREDCFVPVKPKIRKFEKKLIPVLPKLSVEELMETNTYQRFNSTIETVFENTEEATTIAELDEDGDVPPEMLIAKYQLHDLCTEAAKLKALGAMESIPAERLVRLLNILEKNIRDGAKVSPLADPDDDVDESRLWTQLAMERVQRAVDASLVSLHIMTSHNMPKTIYLEDVIDRIIIFMKFQLQNTIYPSYDPVYKIDSKSKTEHYNSSGRKKRGHTKEVREKSILQVYNKMHELVSLLAELLNIQVLTDTTVLHASTLGVAPFFVESVSDLQLSALKLVTVIFTKYEKHRRLLLDDILASIARLPSSKRSLRTYRLNSEDHIQMLTALVLQLIQCVVTLPDSASLGIQEKHKHDKSRDDKSKEEEEKKEGNKSSHVDVDVLIISKYEMATRLAGNFLTVFLNKCGSKGEEIDYRPLFENFIQDLLATVNKPEWPAAELLLSLLGNLLVSHFSNKSSDMSLRVASIDYLGVVAARLRKDAVTSHCKLATIDQIITDIKLEQARDSEYDQVKDREINGLDQDEERTVFLQKVLLDYLAVNATKDSALGYARHFYLAQWYRDCVLEKTRVGTPKTSPTKKSYKKKGRKKNRHHSDDESEPEIEDPDPDENDNNEQKFSELYRIIGEKKKLIVSKIRPYSSGTKPDILQTYIDYNSAELISQFVASKRAFSQSFDRFLNQILRVLTESSIAIRTKAMKCLTMIVEADPSVLARSDMQLGVKHSFLDLSTSVREAAVDLVGKFVLSRPDLIDKYYDMLLARILDTGVSVRKRVIKILKDVCMECPDYPKIPEICVKMIRRVNDEEGIRKLVMEVFQNMWFTPVRERPSVDSTALLRKVMNITDVVAASKDMGLEWFEQLLVSLFKPKEDKEDSTKMLTEPPKALLTACKQIVDCLIENVLRLEETNLDRDPSAEVSGKHGSSQRLVACLTTLYLFSKIRPQLLVNHAITLQPYLSLKCQTQGDYQIISSVAHTLELVVPLMEHPSETFLAQLEEDSVKLILLHDPSVVASCLSCLGSIVNNVTRNFKLIRDCFNKYYGHLTTYKSMYETNPENPVLFKFRPFFRRALFTVGLLLRHFDFTDSNVIEGLPEKIKDQVFETLNYFVHQDNDDMRQFTLSAIGSLCIRHYEFMLIPQLKELYHHLLTSELAQVPMRIQVLNNIELYLQEEEKRMIKQDLEWAKLSKQENLKEMGDVSSGMASTVIQLYLKEILESFLHVNVNVRHAALKVIQLILAQGLVHPVQIVPYLVCMSTDCEKMVSHSADKQLQDIEKKYPGFIHMKSQFGIKLSYRLQEILQGDAPCVRGMRLKEGEYPGALNGFLYTILRNTKQQRRAIVLSFLKQFDEISKTSLYQMLYLADNLAYFSYQVQDEPLFIIHHIDIIISMSGTNLLQSFKEALLPKEGSNPQQPAPMDTGEIPILPQPEIHPVPFSAENATPKPEQLLATLEDEEDDEEDEESVLTRLPENTTLLREYITASQGFLLLLTLRQHLKDLYGFSDAKISQYSPSEAAKVYEKAVNRKSSLMFKPKATLQRLKEGARIDTELDEEGRKRLIKEYLDFKQLMLKFDPEDPDDDDDANANQKKESEPTGPPIILRLPNNDPHRMQTDTADSTVSSAQQTPAQYRVNSEHPNHSLNQSIPPRVPKLTIHTHPEIREQHRKHRTHKAEKPKKHKKKKRRRLSDSSDSGDDCSDPDFLV